MANIDSGSFPINIRIRNGILIVQCQDLGIAVTRNFDLIRGSKDIGDLYFEVFKKVNDELERRRFDKRLIPPPTEYRTTINSHADFDLSISVASKISGLSQYTLRSTSKELLPCLKTPKGHRRYRRSDLINFVNKLNIS